MTATDAREAPLTTLAALATDLAPSRHAARRPRPVPFAGGVVAAFAYETRHAIEPGTAVAETPDAPRLVGGVYDAALSYDHRARRWWLASWHLDASALDRLAEEIRDAAEAARGARLAVLPAQTPAIATSLDEHAWAERVERIHRYIAAGDVYQVNLTARFAARLPAPALDVYERLRATEPVPFGAYLDLGAERVLSRSPELFLRRRGGRVATSPIKGTRPRGTDSARDAALADELVRDPKERAEHVMIVDLERNDLGRVCRIGSVAVERFADCVPFATVQHLVSTVSGTLRSGVGTADLLRATFPSGSITGAPKIRAMEVIAELETVPRDFYTGAIGWIDASGDCDLNVAIRTAVVRGETLAYHAGGGIVADSRADREWKELHVKAAAFFRALGVDGARTAASATKRARR